MEIWWILLIIVAVAALISAMLAVSNYGAERFLALHEEMSATQANAHMSVLEFITDVNLEQLEGKLKIARTDKKLGDGYASKSKTLVITDETLRGVSIASFSIAAHELGHAIQDHEGNLLKHKQVEASRLGVWQTFSSLHLGVPCDVVFSTISGHFDNFRKPGRRNLSAFGSLEDVDDLYRTRRLQKSNQTFRCVLAKFRYEIGKKISKRGQTNLLERFYEIAFWLERADSQNKNV